MQLYFFKRAPPPWYHNFIMENKDCNKHFQQKPGCFFVQSMNRQAGDDVVKYNQKGGEANNKIREALPQCKGAG